MTARLLSLLTGTFAVCRLAPDAPVPAWAGTGPTGFTSITRTRDELSVICPAAYVPPEQPASGGWSCLRIEGPFGLDETGILAGVVAPLATAGISVFAVATHDTDHLLVTELDAALRALTGAGHTIRSDAACTSTDDHREDGSDNDVAEHHHYRELPCQG